MAHHNNELHSEIEKAPSGDELAFGVLALFLIALCVPVKAQPQTTVLVSAHFDVARQAPIASIVYQKPVMNRVLVNGFLEAWYNTELGFPQKKWTLFSKNWISYSLTPRLSTSIEVEMLYNRPGVAIKWPVEILFQPDKAYVIPKVGFTYRVK